MLLPLHRVPRLPAEHRRAGRPTQTWNIALMSTHVHGLHLWIVTATTENKSKLCLCFQRHRQKQDQPKYQQITLGAGCNFTSLEKKRLTSIGLLYWCQMDFFKHLYIKLKSSGKSETNACQCPWPTHKQYHRKLNQPNKQMQTNLEAELPMF